MSDGRSILYLSTLLALIVVAWVVAVIADVFTGFSAPGALYALGGVIASALTGAIVTLLKQQH